MSHFERLSAMDASFLELEDDAAHMHVGAVIVFESGPLENDAGGVDIDRVRRYIEAAIARVPRYRQRLAWVPVVKHPFWVDDDRFNIHYHVRHTALPRPGDDRQLKRLAGRIFSQRLDRRRPLWEIWVVEGLEGGRFALISKAHHCMVDGMAGVGLIAAILRTNTDASIPELEPWSPRPAPSARELAAAEVKRRASAPREIFQRFLAMAKGESPLPEHARDAAAGLMETLGTGVIPADKTTLWGRTLGPNRRFDAVRLDLAAVKAVKKALGGKLNDVVLATVAGALRRFFARRGTAPERITDFRVAVPVSVKSKAGAMGNHVSAMLVSLPVHMSDTRARYDTVVSESQRTKSVSHVAESGELLNEVADYTGVALLTTTIRLATLVHAYNLVVTNVPGPPFPLYLLGARLTAIYPQVPLAGHQTVGIALFSYAGGLFFGFNADWQAVPDLHELAQDVEAAFDELSTLAQAVSAGEARVTDA